MRTSIAILSLAFVPTLALPVLTFAQESRNIQEIVVIGVRDTHTIVTDDTLIAPADTAQMLRMMPGANINKNGELTGIAQYRGMYGDRIKVSVDGAQISGAGPNSMDAPLSYAPVALLQSLTINRGIAPVSAGQETIGGFVQAETYSGDFTNSNDFSVNGRTYFGLQSANEGAVASGFVSLANRNHIFRGFVMNESADDLDFPGGSIAPTEYERERFDLGYGYSRGDHEFSIDVARNNTGNAGTPALPMDILSIDSDLFRSRYDWTSGDYSLTTEVFGSDNSHWMTNFHLRRPPQNMTTLSADPMRFRQTYAVSDNIGFSVKLEQFVANGSWQYGIDGHFTKHDAVITNPNAGPFYIDNFNGSTRDVWGVFAERSLSLSDTLGLDAGLRFNRVTTDTGTVSANLNPMNAAAGMPVMMNNMASMLANQFNNQDLSQQDNNVDWFARLSMQTDNDLTWYLGAARKSRSASYQERYLWIPMESTGGLADGKTYIGTPDLDPELAHELELGFDWESDRFNLYPRLFYKRVSDFIQGTPSNNATANQFALTMSNMGMGLPDPLQFSNTDATFYGADIESNFELSERLTLRAVASLVRGKRDDINDDLYRVSPDNLILALDYTGNNWMASLETINYADQNRVSATNLEQTTDGYSIVNLSSLLNISESTQLRIGVENLLDEEYLDHLAGYNRAFNPDIPVRSRMPGMGRNFYGRLMWYF
ncbi:MAG: TonB-dependent receptor [Pseudohongiellaceae bacterium]